MRALLVMAWLGACAGRQVATSAVQQAATMIGGDARTGTCSSEPERPAGGGTGSVLLPVAVIGAAAVVIAGAAYGYHLVQPPARIAHRARHPAD
jgi:hypothetical protein